jgi:hypothetical protein
VAQLLLRWATALLLINIFGLKHVFKVGFAKVYTDGTVKYGFFASSDEPRNLEEALKDKNWKAAMDSEYMALMKNKTWHLVPPRKGINVVDCKWV